MKTDFRLTAIMNSSLKRYGEKYQDRIRWHMHLRMQPTQDRCRMSVLTDLKTMRNSRFLRITSILTSCGENYLHQSLPKCRTILFLRWMIRRVIIIISFVLHIMTKNSRIFLNATNTTTEWKGTHSLLTSLTTLCISLQELFRMSKT